MIVRWDHHERRTVFQVGWKTNERGSTMGEWTTETDDGYAV